MKIFRKIVFSIILFMLLFSSGNVFANDDLASFIGEIEYTEEFKEWLELEDDERSKVIMPKVYKIPASNFIYTNPIKIAHTVGSATLAKYDLREYISENLQV